MSIISVDNLTFCYDGSYDNIFENVSFKIDTDWRLGFIGRNGRGKTTFLNLLMGRYRYSGSVSAAVSFDYFPFEVPDASMTTLEVIESISPDYEHWRLMKELNLMKATDDILYRPFSTLSNGERTKALLAALFIKENNFLLIDEPTNHLDMEARRMVSDYLKNKSGFILVSHDRAFLDKCIDHVLSINKSTIEVQKGNFSTWQLNKEMRDNFEIDKNEKLKKDIARLKRAAGRMAGWSDDIEETKIGFGPCDRGNIGAKAAKMMRHAKAVETRRERAVEEKEKLLKDIEYFSPLKVNPMPYFSDTLLSLKGVGISYGERMACRDVSLTIRQGDRIALCGKNGCGKSSVLKLILGENLEFEGEVNIGSRLKISYVRQDTSKLSGSLTAFAKSRGIDESLFKTILRKLDFSRIQFEKDISDYSEGQKKKTLIAGSLCECANLYVWDEPLNFIDVMSRMQIERLIMESMPTMLIVEHDEAFLNLVATDIIRL